MHTGPSPSSTSRVGSARSPTTTGNVFPFHCVEIADGTRSIAVGTPVRFDVLAKLGRYEAARIVSWTTANDESST